MAKISVAPLIAATILATASAMPPGTAAAQESLQPGEAYVTRFSGTATQGGRTVINLQGTVGSIIDLRPPGGPPQGEHWWNEPQRSPATAGQVGQVFGVALDDSASPRIFVTATSAFGLHRTPNNADWTPGMWGQGGGPGSIYVLDPANGLRPRVFADVTLDGRRNTGAALGNIAFDRWNKQLYVSDLETGMIHRLRASDGTDVGRFDHGVAGRTGFFDVATGALVPLPSVAFDPASAARVSNCAAGEFARTPACWNFADFRRRVWGLGVRRDPASREVRLFYAVWGSEGFGHPDFAAAGDDQRNSVWSIRIAENGDFDLTNVRREFFLPDFFRSPEAIARSGRSHPVSDIAFPAFGNQTVMLLAERGGVRNLGLDAENAFARPHESRVLRYELTPQGNWELAGRYDIGYDDRKEAGPPYLRAGASGGVSFGMGYGESWGIDTSKPDAFVWMTGDGLCSPRSLCFDASSNQHNNSSQVHGLLGRAETPYEAAEPATAFARYPARGPSTPATGPDRSFIIDTDINVDASGGGIQSELRRNDATRIGDVAIYQTAPTEVAGMPAPPPGPAEVPPGVPSELLPPAGWQPAPLGPDGWPIPPPLVIDTDLAIQKTGPAQCQAGVNCTYTITISNVGAVGYTGPLAVNDTMPAGATLTAAAAGWHCDVAGASVRCHTLAFATLNVGASATLTLTLQLPAAAAGTTVTNCVAIDWAEMGTDDGPGDGNDQACADTLVTQGFDLGLQKSGPVQCVENANCQFSIVITNHGPGQFSGPLAVRDLLPANASLAANSLNWTCVQNGAEVECQRPAVTLPPAAMATLVLVLKLPDGIAGGAVQNCAQINWAAMGANDGAADAHADQDCHTVNVIGKAGFFDLSIDKTGPAHCNAGGHCSYTIRITNNGPDDYTGHTAILDTPPLGATFVSSDAGFVCVVVGVNILCDQPGAVLLHPGQSRTFTLTIQLPAPIPGPTVINCGWVHWGPPFMPPNDNPPGPGEFSDQDCVETGVGNAFDITIAKAGPAACYEGHICQYIVTLTNNGPQAYNGVLAFDDTLPPGAVLESATGAHTCQPLGAPGTVTCNVLAGGMAPGATRNVTLRVRLPDPVAGNTVTNCTTMRWAPVPPGFLGPDYTGDDNAGNDGPACVTTPIIAADLAPFGGTTCRRGETCNLDVRIENRGGRQFQGSAGLRGTLDPAVSITSITGQTAGLSCNVTGNGTYECRSEQLSLKPGDTARLRLAIAIPADFPHRRIIHRKEMLWPDLRVKDRKPENDRHVSIILIEQPAEPRVPPQVCAGGRISGLDCVCPQNALRKQTGPNAFACVLPPTLPSGAQCISGQMVRGRCTCPRGTELQQTATNVFSCVSVPPREVTPVRPALICTGGEVQRGQCICPTGTTRQQTATNAFTCVAPPPPSLTCSGGRVARGQCTCPAGTDRQQTGPNAFTCVKPPTPSLTCSGGQVSRGQCICPPRTNRRQTGPRAFVCVPAPIPSVICSGGQVLRGQCICPAGTNRRQTGPNTFTCVAVPSVKPPPQPGIRPAPQQQPSGPIRARPFVPAQTVQ